MFLLFVSHFKYVVIKLVIFRQYNIFFLSAKPTKLTFSGTQGLPLDIDILYQCQFSRRFRRGLHQRNFVCFIYIFLKGSSLFSLSSNLL